MLAVIGTSFLPLSDRATNVSSTTERPPSGGLLFLQHNQTSVTAGARLARGQKATSPTRQPTPGSSRPFDRYFAFCLARSKNSDLEAGDSVVAHRLERNYFSEVLIDVNFVLRFVPRPFTAAMIAIEMPAAISPYSIAVAPDRSSQNLQMSCFI